MKMLQWGLLGLLVVALCGLSTCELSSYFDTAAAELRKSAKELVSVEFELKRARRLVEGLDGAIRDSAERVVRNKLAIERLEKKIAGYDEKLAAGRERILQLKDELKRGSTSYVLAGKTYSTEELREELKFRFDRYQEMEATVRDLTRVLEQLREKRSANERRFRQLSATKVRLAAEIEGLDARLSALRAAEATGEVASTGADVSRIRRLLDEIHVRIRVDESSADLVEDAERRFGIGPLEDNRDVVETVESYFDASN